MPKRHIIIIILNLIFILALSINTPVSADQCTDNDNDGYAVEGGICGTPDCDDQDNKVFPGAPKICDGKDSNCDGKRDYPTDKDEDGDGVPWCGGDCNDNHPLVHVGADDNNCDNIDNDCSGTPDDGYVPLLSNCGQGACFSTGRIECQGGMIVDTCTPESPAFDDSACNGIDDDCDGTTDEDYIATISTCGLGVCASSGLLSCQNGTETNTCKAGTAQTEGPSDASTCYDHYDNDCDGLTDAADEDSCGFLDMDNDLDGYSQNDGDCDDQDSAVYPGAPQLCDGKDNDCDGIMDFETDEDRDGDGVPVCGGDCNDDDAYRSPLNREGPFGDITCSDDIDNDCDGMTDSDDTKCINTCIDNDGDGFGNPGNADCPNGAVIDCNDSDPDENPGHIVYCNSAGSACSSFAALTWTAPQINVDGTDLTDLAGYKIYYGAASENYTEVLETGNNTCYIIDNLTPQEWCFTVTAYDIAGNESDIADEVCKFIN